MVDFDFPERLFGRLWRKVRPKAEDRQADRDWFQARAARSEALASMWACRRVVVREAERYGGVRGDVLLMPRLENVPGESKAAREQFWQTRLVLAAEMTRARPADGEDKLSSVPEAWREAVRHLLRAREAEDRLRTESSEWERRALVARREWAGPAVEDRSAGAAEEAWRDLALAFFVGAMDSPELLARAAALPPCPIYFVDPGLPLWGGALKPSEARAADRAALELPAQESGAEAGVEEGASELPARPRDFLRRTTLEDDPDKDVMPEHVFEKIETLEEHVGGRRRTDGEDELDDHADALDELDLRDLVRGGPEVESVYQLEMEAWDGVPEVGDLLPGETGVSYDEWDGVRARYRRDWVTVYPTPAPQPVPGWAQPVRSEQRATLRRLTRLVDQRRERREFQRRVLEGAELDLEEYVVEQGAVRA
ncbi:MAG: hypothetical protein CMJ94_00160, partial [Planctomycetes bacterium]|nr:hypothetical protein [Planctomycetota bacterium]